MNALTKFSIDIVSMGAAPVAYAMQNDSNTRTIELNLTANGAAWEIPSGMSVAVAFRKSDGTAGLYDVLPDGTRACSYSGNVVRVVLAPQVLTAWGRVEVAVVIQDPNTLDRVATFPLFLDVARDPAAGESISNDYYNYKTMEQINDAIDELWAAVGSGGSGGSGGSCGCSITVARKGSEDDPVSLSGYGIGAGDVVRFQEGDYYVEPFDMEGLNHVTFLLGDARIHCVGDHFLEATRCDDLQIIGGTVMGGNGTVMGIQIKDCLRPVLQQVCFNAIGSATVENTKGLVILGDCTGFLVDRCVVDGVSAGVVSSDGWIHAYGILVNRLGSTNSYSRKGQILHCRIANVAGIDTDTVKADGDGIFIQRPPYLDDSGKVAGIDQVIDIDGCVFKNCKKRGVKSAAWGTTVRDCVFEGDFYYAPVDLQYGHGTVDRCRIYNASNYTGSVTSGVVANDGGFVVRDTYINCLYVNEDGTNGRHPAVRMDKRQPGSIFNKTVPWDPILVERCHFDEVSYGVYASTSVSGVDTYRLTALEVLDCRWGAFYHGYGVFVSSTVFDEVDVARFVDFRFDAGDTSAEVKAVNSNFSLPIMLGADPTKAYEIHSRYWLDKVVTSSNTPTAAHTRIVSVGEGCRKEYTAYGSRIWGSGDPNGKVSGDPEYALLRGSKVGDEYTDTATGKKYTCTAAGGVGVWEEMGSGSGDGICTLPYGGSKEWLEANGDPAQLYQIDGYVWGYVESDGWTKSGTRFLVVSSESQMVNQGGTGYLLRSGDEGTVYAYSEASGDKDVPVYDALPETANEGDIVAVGGRKYKAVLTETKVPAYTNRAVTLHEGYRYNSIGVLTEQSDAAACEDVIPFSSGTVVRVKGLGKLDTVNCMGYGSEEALTVSASLKPAAAASSAYLTYSYDADTDTATLVSTGSSYAVCLRIAGILSGAISDVIITVNEEITTKTETVVSWTDNGEYVAPVEAGWNATEEVYTVIDALSASAEDGDIAVYSGDGYVYSYIDGSGWMAMSKYSPPTLAVDGELSDTSSNAVQNKVVKAAIDEVDAKAISNANKILTLQNQVEAMGGDASSDAVTIPSYWEEMVAAKTETVKALQQAGGKNCVCFAWASDTHIPDEDPGTDKGYSGGRTTDLGKVMAKMMDDCEVPFAMLSGDINTRASYSTEAEYLETLAKVPVYLAPLWGTDRLLMAMGNHDGVWGDSTGYYRHQFTPQRLWQVFFRGQALDFRRVFSEDGLYYYVDNIPQKTRFIVLNSHFGGEYAEDEDGWAVNNRFATSCYGQAQLDWLANVALDMPEGYGAVLTCHTPPKPVNGATTAGIDSAQLNGIINAYCGRTTFSGSCTAGVDGWSNSEISVDFTDAKGEIIALFAGHIHWDTVDTTTLACPLITIISAGAPANTVNVVDGETVPVRYPWGTDQETSFDVVTINRATRTIYCTRVGAGEDREISY